jgi:hypothetical protein
VLSNLGLQTEFRCWVFTDTARITARTETIDQGVWPVPIAEVLPASAAIGPESPRASIFSGRPLLRIPKLD